MFIFFFVRVIQSDRNFDRNSEDHGDQYYFSDPLHENSALPTIVEVLVDRYDVPIRLDERSIALLRIGETTQLDLSYAHAALRIMGIDDRVIDRLSCTIIEKIQCNSDRVFLVQVRSWQLLAKFRWIQLEKLIYIPRPDNPWWMTEEVNREFLKLFAEGSGSVSPEDPPRDPR